MNENNKTREQLLDVINELQAENIKLVNSEKRYKIFVENASDAFYISDMQGNFIYVNKAAYEVLGYTREELLKLSILDVDMNFSRDKLADILGSLKLNESQHIASKHKKKNGEIFPVDVRVQSFGLKSEPLLLSLARDVTKRRSVEEQLKANNQQLIAAEQQLRSANQQLEANNQQLVANEQQLRAINQQLRSNEIELKTAKEFSEKLLETANVFILNLDTDGRITLFNEFAEKLTGYKKNEVLGKNWFDLFVPKMNADEIPEVFTNVLKQMPKFSSYENPILCKDGSLRYISWQNTIIKSEKKDVSGIMSIGLDITERKQAEKALRESELMLKEAEKIANVGSWYWEVEPDIVKWSDELYRITKQNPELPPPTYAVMSKIYTPESWELLSTAVGKAVTEGTSYNLELNMVRSDNEIRVVQTVGKAIQDDTGRVVSLFGMVQDITERKQAEEELKESEEKFKALYDNAPLSYQSLDDDGCFNDVNPTWLTTLGYKREEVIGKCFSDFLHQDYNQHFQKNFPAFKKRGYVHDVQIKIRHKDGYYLDISFEGCVGYYTDGSFKQTYCVFQDITDRKKAEEDIKNRNKELELFNKIAVGRELIMINLKKEINSLLEEAGKKPAYKIVD